MPWGSVQIPLSPLYAPSIAPSKATFDFGFDIPTPKHPWTSLETIAVSAASVSETQNDTDFEAGDRFFINSTVHDFTWDGIDVTAPGRMANMILQGNSGSVMAGEMLELMGPSGSGKSTLLNVLVMRSRLSHMGSDIDFTTRLAAGMRALPLCRTRYLDVLNALGLGGQKDILVSPLLKAGISDEPTSGLDSVASHQMMKFLRDIARRHKLLIIASIHQPSTAAFNLFDKVMLISRDRTCCFGPRCEVSTCFSEIAPIPQYTNPAEHMLEMVNKDFGTDATRLDAIFEQWESHKPAVQVKITEIHSPKPNPSGDCSISTLSATTILMHRSWIKAYRDPLVYGTRFSNNICLSLVVGTVWLRLKYTQTYIQPFINCIFFSDTFMALIAIVYAPPAIEDIRMLFKEHANGLYDPTAFILANFLTGMPWLFAMALIFSSVAYWLANFNVDMQQFLIFTAWFFIGLLAAERVVMLVSAIVPVFVTALAPFAFANGLWLAVNGFLVPVGILNGFWKWAYHVNFQAYIFQGMMVNQFRRSVYDCER